MKQDVFAPPEYKEGIDADAVCSQCNTVNPEGTLICKMCGNNLRDQRLLRMTADQMLDTEGKKGEGSSFLYKALPILGLLIVLWLGINASRMVSMLTKAESDDNSVYVNLADTVWNGPDKGIYTELAGKLGTSPIDSTEAEEARMNLAPMPDIASGKYALYARMGTEEQFAGVAMVKMDGTSLYYVAVLENGAEIRGKSTLLEDAFISQWDEGALFMDNIYYSLTGAAVLQPDGSVALSGHTDLNTIRYDSTAYRMAGAQ